MPKKVENEVVRVALFRPQPKPEITGKTNWQTFAVQRPNWSQLSPNERQLVGGRFFKKEKYNRAIARVTYEETGLKDLDFEAVKDYQNGEWLTRLFVAVLDPSLSHLMTIDFDRNQAAKWFDTYGSGEVARLETRTDDKGKVAMHTRFAFDNAQMIADAVEKIRGNER